MCQADQDQRIAKGNDLSNSSAWKDKCESVTHDRASKYLHDACSVGWVSEKANFMVPCMLVVPWRPRPVAPAPTSAAEKEETGKMYFSKTRERDNNINNTTKKNRNNS